jgi:hypothetical protein
MKSKDIEEERRSDILYTELQEVLEKKIVLTISFITESDYWNPGLQILTNINQLGDSFTIRDYEDEKIYQYTNGLILKEHLYAGIDVSTSDGIFCIFDARGKEHVDPKWKAIILKVIKDSKKNSVISVGIRASEETNWSQLIGELNVDDDLDPKDVVNLLFFRIGEEYRLEVFDQLKVMFSAIKEKS